MADLDEREVLEKLKSATNFPQIDYFEISPSE